LCALLLASVPACRSTTAPSIGRWREAGRSFSTLTGSFIEGAASVTGAIELALRKGDFSQISETTAPQLSLLSDTIATMRELADEVHPDLIAIAEHIVVVAVEWVDAASQAIASGISGDLAAFDVQTTRMRQARSELETSVKSWNAAIEAA
jgi:hypothetical protein